MTGQFEKVEAGIIDWKMEAIRSNRLLAIAEADIARLRGLLNGRDDFIVGKGLWSEFTDSLPQS